VHYVVTEYGAVCLFGKDLLERARLLISIAHPNDRQELQKSVFEIYRVLV
jgi:acyl-CoA hydrolase